MISNSCSYTSDFEIEQTPNLLFQLFTPEEEKLWVPGWDYENIMGTLDIHEDYIFLTKSHDHAANDAIWIVKKYLPEEFLVQYYRVEPQEKVGIITIRCDPVDNKRTRVFVTYKYFGLSESGNNFIQNFTQEDYDSYIENWKYLIESYYLKGESVV
ncbi:hypothetical protein ACFLS9_06565 [Bacteroidota bacterium]